MEDHIHMLVDIHPTNSVSDFMRDLKEASSKWLKQNPNFPLFEFWGEGYAAFTYSIKEKETIIEYIKNQKEHHNTVSFAEEYRTFLLENGIEIDERYFLKD